MAHRRTFMLRTVLAIMGLAIAALSPSRADERSPANEETINRLIDDLGAKDFKVRDAAARQLTDLEGTAIPALLKAQKSADAEVARLAERILDELDRAATRRSLDLLREEAKRGEASRVIDRFARWKGSEKDAESWQIAIDFAWDVAKRATKSNSALYERWLADKQMVKKQMITFRKRTSFTRKSA